MHVFHGVTSPVSFSPSFPRGHSLFQTSICSGGVLHRPQVDLCSPWPPWGHRTSCSTVGCTTGSREIPPPVPGAPPSPLLSLVLVSAVASLPFSLPAAVSPPLNLSSQRLYHHGRWVWPTAGPSWSQLALALSDMAKLLAASHRSRVCGPSHAKALPGRANKFS